MSPLWLLAVLLGGVASQCWEHPSCQELSSESSMLECIHLCHSDLTAETPVIPGDAHLQPLSPSDSESPPPASLSASPSFLLPPPSSSSPPSPQAKRSYSMEHFRWGKPVGRKRRPVKVYTSNGGEDDFPEAFPGEMRRRELGGEAAEKEEQELQEVQEVQQLTQEKKDGGSYKMKHFRWGGPPASKRYGGFMKSWDERSQKPLLTLFRNVINKDGQKTQQGRF
uniref:Proopiomelanocortin a n=1 Tax=Myripristis murdjan TaxID=586833 RepID=A0A667ZEP2_9TELE